MTNDNILQVVMDDLCTGCGTCIAICPTEAINLTLNKNKGLYEPKIENKLCNNCFKCLTICPGHRTDFKLLNYEIFGEEPWNFLLGNFLSCYIGHSNDENIRYNSSSGGLITQLLIYALEEGIVDGALVTRMKKDDPLEPEPFIARTKEEIIEASRSKYCPVPLNIGLKEIIDSENGEKFAVVGLPCQLNGIRNAEKLDKTLKNKVILHLGIFCSHTDSFKGTEFFCKKLGIKKEEIVKLDYRGSGWPGGIKIHLKNGTKKEIKLNDHLFIGFHNSCLFSPLPCVLCNDVTAELSDVSLGDAWLPKIMAEERDGKSMLISRNKKGEELLKSAVEKGFIHLSPINSSKVIESQRTFLFFKKINIKDRIILRNLFKKRSIPIPDLNIRISFYNKIVALVSLINTYLGSKATSLFRYLPINLIVKYTYLYHHLLTLTMEKELLKSKPIKKDEEMNLLILNAHWNNRGDEAAIRAMIDTFKSYIPVKTVRIMFSTNVRIDPGLVQENIESIRTFPQITIPGLCLFLIDLIVNIITSGRFGFTENSKNFISAIDNSDLIIHAPGGPSIGDIYGGLYGEFLYLYRLFLPKLKGKNVYIYAPSMGPFSGKFKNMVRKFVLKRMNIITVRDEISKGYLKDHLKLDSYLTLDSAFQNDIPVTYLERYPEIGSMIDLLKTEKVVGMTITELNWHPVYKDNIILKDNIIDTIRNTIKFLTKRGYYVLLIPQLFCSEEEDPVSKKIVSEETELIDCIKSCSQNVLVLPRKLDSYAQQSIISNLFAMIGMRYHPNIFAAKMNVPSIAIYYEHKTKGFMEELGRLDLAINIERMDDKAIIDRFLYMEKNYDKIKGEIMERNQYLKSKSRKTRELIIDDLDRYYD